MSIRLDHGEDSLGVIHDINVTPFIDVGRVFARSGTLVGHGQSQPIPATFRAPCLRA